MDLESTNGTFLNKEKIEQARYYELIKNDVINFGFSERDYVVMKLNQIYYKIKYVKYINKYFEKF